MKARTPAVIERFYDWLPLDGEDKVIFSYSDGNATLDIEYRDDGKLLVRKVTFERVSHIFKGPIPGIDFLAFEFGDERLDVDCLVEFKNSEFANAYTKYRDDGIGAKLIIWNHYFVAFTSSNIVFHIFATDVYVS